MKFNKQILSSGVFVVSDGKGGRKVELIKDSRIDHWANQHKKMVEAGLKIPAPDWHDPKSLPEKNPKGSKSNYGFWEAVNSADVTDDNGITSRVLNGLLDVPVQADADKIGNSVQETSIYAQDFLDGNGVLWKDVLTQIAVVTKPIESGQKNFEPHEEGHLAIAMSHRLPIQMDMDSVSSMFSSDTGADENDLFSMLEEIAGIAIPQGTSMEGLRDALLLALNQKKLSESNREGGTITKPPEDSHLHEVPVVMSAVNQNGAGNQPAVTPTPTLTPTPDPTPTPTLTPDAVVMSQIKSENAGMLQYVCQKQKESLQQRLQVLHRRNIISADILKTYNESVDAIVMSFDGKNQITKQSIEFQIEALEDVQIAMPAAAPITAMATQDESGNFVIQPQVIPTGETEVTEDRADEIMKQLFSQTSV